MAFGKGNKNIANKPEVRVKIIKTQKKMRLEDNKKYIGMKFNRLTIIDIVKSLKGQSRVKAKCDCGQIKTLPLVVITLGRTKSCGCFQKQTASKNLTKLVKKKFSMRRLKKRCLALWSPIIKERDKVCVVCGSKKCLNAHHFFSELDCPSIRFDFENGVTLCARHHIWGIHKNPEFYRSKIIKYMESLYGENWLLNLWNKINAPFDKSKKNLIKLMQDFEDKYKRRL